MAAAVLIALAVALGLQTAHAQSPMCYPTSDKSYLPLKKGKCFMVTHTFTDSYGLDAVSCKVMAWHPLLYCAM